jgi:hypothetical protein
MNIDLGLVITAITIFGGTIWKLSEIKNQIEKDCDRQLDNLRDQFLELDSKIDLISQRHESGIVSVGNRVTGIHHNARSTIKNLQDQFNQLVNFINEKHNNPNQKFIMRTRLMSKETFNGGEDDESWTAIEYKEK